MKWLRLIFKSIVELARYNKSILAVVLVSLILSEIGFLYFVGFSNGVYLRNVKYTVGLRTYTVKGAENSGFYKIIDMLSQKSFNEYYMEDIVVKADCAGFDDGNIMTIYRRSNKISGIYANGSGICDLYNNADDPP